MQRDIPHVQIVVVACAAAVLGYAVFSVYAVVWLKDATMIGDIIGTWKSFAVAAFAFWLGSSSGGKATAEPSGTSEDPMHVAGAGPGKAPVATTDAQGQPAPTTDAPATYDGPDLSAAPDSDAPEEPTWR
jgi:hypothetical protein